MFVNETSLRQLCLNSIRAQTRLCRHYTPGGSERPKWSREAGTYRL